VSSSVKLPGTYKARCGDCGQLLRVTASDDEVACESCGALMAVPSDPDALSGEPTLFVIGRAEQSMPTVDISTDEVDTTRPKSPAAAKSAERSRSVLDEDADPKPSSRDPSELSTTIFAAPNDDASEDTNFTVEVAPDADAEAEYSPGDADTVAEAFDWPDVPYPSLNVTETVAEEVDEEADTVEIAIPKQSGATKKGKGLADTQLEDSSRSNGKSQAPAEDVVSKKTFQLVLTYASVDSALCLFLLYLLLSVRTHQLESLPDSVKPQVDENGNVTRVRIPPDAPLPPGHTLALGESQRFGDLRVTAERVTRGPIEFSHYADGSTKPGPEGDALKLWLRFEHVGDGPPFAPLDADLTFYRAVETGGDAGLYQWSNNLIRPEGELATWQSVAFVYDHVTTGEWDLAGQKLGEKLEPGESLLTYIPAAPADAELLSGDLVWRVHLRKGIAANGWGITTLIEVPFSESDVMPEGPDA